MNIKEYLGFKSEEEIEDQSVAILFGKLQKHFPEFASEVTLDSAREILKACQKRDEDYRSLSDSMLKMGENADWESAKNLRLDSYLLPFLSSEFSNHVENKKNKGILLADIFNSRMVVIGAVAREWVDDDGNPVFNYTGDGKIPDELLEEVKVAIRLRKKYNKRFAGIVLFGLLLVGLIIYCI